MARQWHISRAAAATLLALPGAACSVSVEPGFGEECVASVIGDAVRNPATPTIAANIAVQSGFAPDSDAAGPPLPTKQVEFATADTAMHYFAVQPRSFERAALIRLDRTSSAPLIHLYVIDRQGNLLHATQMQGGRIVPLSSDDQRVRENFRRERELWRAAGPDHACGRG